MIEIIVVIGILVAIMSLGLFVSMDLFRGYNARSERDVVVSLLERARSRSMNNMHHTRWGVCLSGSNYILFRGSTCSAGVATNEQTPASPSATVTGLSTGVVFSQLGGTTTAATITIAQSGRTSTITINNEGAIIW